MMQLIWFTVPWPLLLEFDCLSSTSTMAQEDNQNGEDVEMHIQRDASDDMLLNYILNYKDKLLNTNFPENIEQIHECLVSQIASQAQTGLVLTRLNEIVKLFMS